MPRCRPAIAVGLLLVCLASGVQAQEVNRGHPLVQGLMAWYPVLPSLSGSVYWYDIAGQHHGTLIGPPTPPKWQIDWSGRYAGMVGFEGNNDYLSIPDVPSLDFGTGPFTICVRIYLGALASADAEFNLVSKTTFYDSTPGWVLEVSTFNGGTTTQYYFTLGITTSPDFNNNLLDSLGFQATDTFYHVCGMRAGTTLSIYIDGQLNVSGSNSAYGLDVTNAFPIEAMRPQTTGGWQGGTGSAFTGGALSNLMLWNRALSAAEVQTVARLQAPEYGGMLLGDDVLAQALAIRKRILMQP